MRADLFGHPLRLPLLARILEFPDQLLLFRVHRHHGLSLLLEGTDLPVDLFELSIAIGVGTALPSLAIGLETIAQVVKQQGHGLRVYPESYAALFLAYLNGIGFRVSSGASRRVIPPMALILIQASLDSVRRS